MVNNNKNNVVAMQSILIIVQVLPNDVIIFKND